MPARFVMGLVGLAALAWADPASAECRVENGELVCDPPPEPTPGGGDIHPTLLDILLQPKSVGRPGS